MNDIILWTSAILFALVAVLHLARLFLGTEIIMGGWSAPKWVSVVGVIVPALLSCGLFRMILNL